MIGKKRDIKQGEDYELASPMFKISIKVSSVQICSTENDSVAAEEPAKQIEWRASRRSGPRRAPEQSKGSAVLIIFRADLCAVCGPWQNLGMAGGRPSAAGR